MLHSFIEAEGILPGHRLPPERELALKLGLARTALRRELAELEREGRVIRHVGRGTFLSDNGLNPGMSHQAGRATEPIRTYPAEVFETRLIVEPPAAALAALRASQFDIQEMGKAIALGSRASTFSEFEKWDAAFHRQVILASRNNLLLTIYDSVHSVRSGKLWGKMKESSLNDDRMLAYTRQHHDIVSAIADRDGARAEACMAEHIVAARNATLGTGGHTAPR